MVNDKILPLNKLAISSAVLAVSVVIMYLLPTLSHLTGLPLYQLEPMKLSVIFAIIFLDKRFSQFIAISVPIFSFLISGHPFLPKAIIIAFELIVFVKIFYYLNRKNQGLLVATLLSMVISKTVYYLMKYSVISAGLLKMNLLSTPIINQIVIIIAYSILVKFIYSEKYATNHPRP